MTGSISHGAARGEPRMVEALRVPPHSTDAEQATIGAVLLDPACYHRVADLLAPEDFYRRDHRRLWAALRDLAERNQPLDAVTVDDWLARNGAGEEVAPGYAVELATTTPSSANVVAYAEIVRDRATKRRVIEHGTSVVNDGFDPSLSGEEVLARAQQGVIELAPAERGGIVQLSDSLTGFIEDLQARWEGRGELGMMTPWGEINRHTHGLPVGVTTILAARPAMGKSIFGLNIALPAAMRGKRVLLFSLEMSKAQIHRRNVAALGHIPHDWLMDPAADHDSDYWAELTATVKRLRGIPLYVDDCADMSIGRLQARARAMHIREPIDLIVVDHIHDMATDPRNPARQEYGRILQGLNVLAKEFNIPLLALAQLARPPKDKTVQRPTMSDLRESGELEQKAGLILMLHRDDYYNRDSVDKGVVEVIVAKGRDIEGGRIFRLRNNYQFMRADDFAVDDDLRFEPKPQPKKRGGLASHYETEREREL